MSFGDNVCCLSSKLFRLSQFKVGQILLDLSFNVGQLHFGRKKNG